MKVAEQVYNLWTQANSGLRKTWRQDQVNAKNYYLNQQLKKTEEADLKAAGMPTFTVNRMTSNIDVMRYFVTSNLPRWKAIGVEGSDVDSASIFQELSDYCWHLSGGRAKLGHIVLDTFTESLGYFWIRVDSHLDRGLGEVIIDNLRPEDVYVDDTTDDMMFKNAGYIIIKKRKTRSKLMNELPEFALQIKKASGKAEATSYSPAVMDSGEQVVSPEDITVAWNALTGEQEDILDYFERYRKVRVKYVSVWLREEKSEADAKQSINEANVRVMEIEKELAVKLKEKVVELDELVRDGSMLVERRELEIEKFQSAATAEIMRNRQQMQYAILDNQSNVVHKKMTLEEYNIIKNDPDFQAILEDKIEYFDTRIEVTSTIGSDTFLYKEFLDSRITEYPIIPLPAIWAGTPYPVSFASLMVGKQTEINKAHQIMIHNANLGSNLRWLGEKGAVPQGKIKEWEVHSTIPGSYNEYTKGFEKPEAVQPMALNNAFYSIVQEGKEDLEYIGGIPGSAMGVAKDQPDTYRGMLANDEYSTRKIRSWMINVFDPVLEQVGEVFKQVSQSLYRSHKVFRLVNPNIEEGTVRKVEMNIPLYNEQGNAVGRFKDYSTARFDVRMVSGSTLPTSRWALIEEYLRWFELGLIDDIATVAELDIKGKDALMQRKSKLSQAMQQLEVNEDEIKQKDAIIQSLKNQVTQGDIHVASSRAEGEIRKVVLETQTQMKLLKQRMADEYAMLEKRIAETEKSAKPKEK